MLSVSLIRVEGPNLALRLIQSDDADYIFALRTNPIYNRYLSEVHGTVKDQRLYIDSYKTREKKLLELYYVIERKDGVRCGLVRLYNIANDKFTWGSWILDENKPMVGALESAYLVYTIAFDLLSLKKSEFQVDNNNVSVIKFHINFGAVKIKSDKEKTFFCYLKNDFDLRRLSILQILNKWSIKNQKNKR